MIAKESALILQKGEKILKEFSNVFYSGVGYVNIGFVSGIGSSVGGGTAIGTGLFSGKQVKRTGSVWDAKPAHLYVTNKRIIFCDAKISFWGRKEESIGTPFTEIFYEQLRGITKSAKLGMPAIDISVASANGIENAKFWFHSGGGAVSKSDEAEKRRDEIFSLINNHI